jgi:hypothetical protein
MVPFWYYFEQKMVLSGTCDYWSGAAARFTGVRFVVGTSEILRFSSE